MKTRVPHTVKNILMVSIIMYCTGCIFNKSTDPSIDDSFEPVEEVSLVNGAEDVTVTVNNDDNAYFSLTFSNITENNIIENGTKEGWCIDWKRGINSNNGTYKGIRLFSTDNVEKWKKLNYLINIKDALMDDDASIGFREIQAAIWTLRAHPEFDLDKLAVEQLPNNMQADGEPQFSYDKVSNILDTVDDGYSSFDFKSGTKFAVIAETPSDVQTIFTVVEKK
ncbi:hypothetical protein [Fodinibius saliphilus]|uniref:hypothetical protein n=1 Tax=Fodinibius saliphilus TaxID=1920650 RepID=UPI00110854E0|nr:hypothetical protein [Fodinibius saliphilus]